MSNQPNQPDLTCSCELKLPRERGKMPAAASTLLSPLQYGLWIAAPAGQLVIAFAMVCRRAHREYPCFFAYAVFHIIQAVVGIVVRQHAYGAYFFFYWACEALDALFSLLIVQEVFSHVFRQYGALERLGQVLFRWAVLMLLAIAILTAASAPGNDRSRLIAGLFVAERSIQFILCGLLFFLFFLSKHFGLHWRHFAFGIAFGMGIMASILTITAALQAHFHRSELASNLVPPLAFNIAVGIWVAYSLLPEPKLKTEARLAENGDLRKWNDVLAQRAMPWL